MEQKNKKKRRRKEKKKKKKRNRKNKEKESSLLGTVNIQPKFEMNDRKLPLDVNLWTPHPLLPEPHG